MRMQDSNESHSADSRRDEHADDIFAWFLTRRQSVSWQRDWLAVL